MVWAVDRGVVPPGWWRRVTNRNKAGVWDAHTECSEAEHQACEAAKNWMRARPMCSWFRDLTVGEVDVKLGTTPPHQPYMLDNAPQEARTYSDCQWGDPTTCRQAWQDGGVMPLTHAAHGQQWNNNKYRNDVFMCTCLSDCTLHTAQGNSGHGLDAQGRRVLRCWEGRCDKPCRYAQLGAAVWPGKGVPRRRSCLLCLDATKKEPNRNRQRDNNAQVRSVLWTLPTPRLTCDAQRPSNQATLQESCLEEMHQGAEPAQSGAACRHDVWAWLHPSRTSDCC